MLGLCLLGYVKRSFPCPREHIITLVFFCYRRSPSLIALNPEHIAWQEQYQLILGWILFSLMENVLGQVIQCMPLIGVVNSSFFFASSPQTRIHDFKHDLSTITKGPLTMSYYNKKSKSLTDSFVELANLSRHKILFTLNGLGPIYDPFSISIYEVGGSIGDRCSWSFS